MLHTPINESLYLKEWFLKIILLPGLDGTGYLFDPFLDCALNRHETTVLPLVQDRVLSSSEQAKYIANLIGTEPCVLRAESYSGLIAYELVQKYTTSVRHIVFIASFLSKPSIISGMGVYVPTSLVKTKFVPVNVIGMTLFGHWQTKSLTNTFLHAIRGVESRVLKSRLKELSTLSNPTKLISIPCTYIQASKDQFVANQALRDFDHVCQNLNVHVVNGTHFLAQTNPKACWEIVNEVSV